MQNQMANLPPRLSIDPQEFNHQMEGARHLPNISEAVRTKVTQRLRRVHASLFLTDEECLSEEDVSPVKRSRGTIKSGRLRTRDTQVVHHVKWSHKMVVYSQGKAPVYEDISLALFTSGYLVVVSEEGPSIKEYMLVHLREMFEDVEV